MGVIIGLQTVELSNEPNMFNVKSKVTLYSNMADNRKKFEERMYLNFCAENSDEDFHDIFIMSERYELHELKKLIKEWDDGEGCL